MPKTHYPFALYQFTSDTNDTKSIQDDYRDLISFMVMKEQEVITSSFTNAIEQVTQDTEILKGSVNRVGSKIGLSPVFSVTEKSHYKHLYNFSEMLRANLTSLVGSYVQRSYLFDVITNLPDAEPLLIAKAYKEITGKNVSRPQVDKVLSAIRKNGSIDSLPSPPAKLPLWATDTHHCSLVQKGRELFLTIKTNNGLKVLTFMIPSHVPISNVKFTRPTIMMGKKNRVMFHFTAEQTIESPITPMGWLGVDVGIKNTYVATGVTENSLSQSWSDTKQIRTVTARIDNLKQHWSYNKSKAFLNKDRYPERYQAQTLEATHISHKISRLKNYRAHLIANTLIQIAHTNNLGISLEQLNWVPGSHWEQSLVQTKIKDEATRYGVMVKKVSAKNTSKTCSRCGSLDITFKGRTLVCKSCDYHIDSDNNASIIIALRALSLKTAPPYYHRWDTRTITVTGHLSEVPFVDSSTIFTNSHLASIVRI